MVNKGRSYDFRDGDTFKFIRFKRTAGFPHLKHFLDKREKDYLNGILEDHTISVPEEVVDQFSDQKLFLKCLKRLSLNQGLKISLAI